MHTEPRAATKVRRVLLVPRAAWGPGIAGFQPGFEPDPNVGSRILADHLVDSSFIDPGDFPWNPFGGRDTLLQSIDPLRALRILLRERGADIIVAAGEGGALLPLLLRGAFGFKVPIALWDIGFTSGWKLRQNILQAVVPRADAIFVLSASQKRYIEARWAPRGEVVVVGHMVDTDFFHPIDVPRLDYVLSVGDDVGRDYSTLLRAADGLDCDLLIRSSRSLPDWISGLPRVRALRERLSYSALRDLYANARFVVVPVHDTLNASGVTSLLEAAAMGKAIIVSDSQALADFSIAEETCVRVPCGDTGAMRAAMARLIDDPLTCARLGRNARRLVLESHSMKAFYARYASKLRRVIQTVPRT